MTTPVGVDSYKPYQVSELNVGRRRRAVHRGQVAPGIPRVGASKRPVSGSLLYRQTGDYPIFPIVRNCGDSGTADVRGVAKAALASYCGAAVAGPRSCPPSSPSIDCLLCLGGTRTNDAFDKLI